MKNIAFLFFITAVVAVLLGMMWGIAMSITGNHSLLSAHAHLNLIGWVTFGLFGVYYAITPHAASGQLPLLHYGLSLSGVILMVAGIALVIKGASSIPVEIGSILTFCSMALFLLIVIRNGIGHRKETPSMPCRLAKPELSSDPISNYQSRLQ